MKTTAILALLFLLSSPVLAKPPTFPGGKNMADRERLPKASYKPRPRSACVTIPGYGTKCGGGPVKFTDVLDLLESLGWPAIYTDDKPAENLSPRQAYRDRLAKRRFEALEARRKRNGK